MSPLNKLPWRTRLHCRSGAGEPGSRSPSATDAPPERRPDRPARFDRSRCGAGRSGVPGVRSKRQTDPGEGAARGGAHLPKRVVFTASASRGPLTRETDARWIAAAVREIAGVPAMVAARPGRLFSGLMVALSCSDRLRAVGTARSSAKGASRRPGRGGAGRRGPRDRRVTAEHVT